MARKPLTVGIIGLGYGRAHIPAFQANRCEVIAVCQRDGGAAQKVAERYGVPQVFTRWEALLERARPAIVVVAAPPALHKVIALQAFAGGAHVLCEKPLAMDAAEARAMAEAAARAGRVAMTAFNWRFPAAMQRFHALATQGQVGRPLHLAGRWLGARWADEGAPITWRMDRAQAGHGAMGDMGVHLVDMVRWSFGEFARVFARGGVAYASRTTPDGKPADAEDHCAVLAELRCGAVVTLQASRAAHGANQASLEVYGTSGALAYRLDRNDPRWHRGGELLAASGSGALAPVKVPPVVPRSAGEGDAMEVVGKATIAPLVKRMLDAIRKDEPASPSFEDGVRAQAVLDAVLESERTAAWVAVA
ncbi:MAG TPA: Gfo/Idh/MocA family oxidoreductase [Methylomirabilota bacterium]|nr:Gfo/Idh/MocA family oxidoreductase [Methylomirabilota bacterium]